MSHANGFRVPKGSGGVRYNSMEGFFAEFEEEREEKRKSLEIKTSE